MLIERPRSIHSNPSFVTTTIGSPVEFSGFREFRSWSLESKTRKTTLYMTTLRLIDSMIDRVTKGMYKNIRSTTKRIYINARINCQPKPLDICTLKNNIVYGVWRSMMHPSSRRSYRTIVNQKKESCREPHITTRQSTKKEQTTKCAMRWNHRDQIDTSGSTRRWPDGFPGVDLIQYCSRVMKSHRCPHITYQISIKDATPFQLERGH
jgi:hypothetical protein